MVLGVNLDSLFLQPWWLYTLLSAIPLILLYLIRPKPQEHKIPSLMFFMRQQGVDKERNFFKRFSKDWLFWLQLFTLIALSAAAAKPFVNVQEGQLSENVVIVLDSSASMQADDRFEDAKEKAMDELGDTNTIILARNQPAVVKEQVGKSEAQRYLQGLEPGATSTAIYDATRAALEYASENTNVVILSDFIETEVENDVNSAVRALRSKGAIVKLEPYTSELGNIGITDVVVKEQKTTVKVRNYYTETKEVPISVNNVEETLSIAPGSTEVFTFSTPSGVNTVDIETDDEFSVDDTAYVSTPQTTELDVLFITNNQQVKQSNLWIAFKAIDKTSSYTINFDIAQPPTKPQIDHDIIVLKQFSQDKILPGVFTDIQDEVSNGASLIITPQQGLFSVDPLQPLLPVTYQGTNAQGGEISAASPPIERLTSGVNFGSADYYFQTTPKDGTREVAVADNSTIIGFTNQGQGSIFYYGIFDQDITVEGETKRSSFKNDLHYPIFWKRTVDVMTNTPSLDTLNRNTGEYARPSGRAETPSGEVIQGAFMLDKQGVYTIEGNRIAANLANAEESDISASFAAERSRRGVETEQGKEPKPVTQYAIGLAALLLLGEFTYTKYRGDM